LGDFELYKFIPDVVESDQAIVYFHGGGFVLSEIPFYRHFLSTMGLSDLRILESNFIFSNFLLNFSSKFEFFDAVLNKVRTSSLI